MVGLQKPKSWLSNTHIAANGHNITQWKSKAYNKTCSSDKERKIIERVTLYNIAVNEQCS